LNGYEDLVDNVAAQALSQSLPRVLTVATSIRDDSLATLVKLELMGYWEDNPEMSADVVVPEYRTVAGNWYDDYGRRFLVQDEKIAFVNEIRLRQGVAELEGYSTATQVLSMRQPSYAEAIRDSLKVNVSVFQFHANTICQVLANIRVHILEELAQRQEAIAAVRISKQEPGDDIILVKPQLYGVGIDLRALWRRTLGSKG